MTDCACPVESLTTYHYYFRKHPRIKPPQRINKIRQNDEELLSGYAGNNLKVNGKAVTSKIWPKILNHAEEYENFLKRLKCCKHTSNIFKRNFQCPPTQTDVIDEMMKNSGKSVYQLIFSPNVFIPRKESMRFAKLIPPSVKMAHYETTYRTSYNRFSEFDHFKGILNRDNFKKDDKVELRNDLKKLNFCGTSTYHDTLSIPGKFHAKRTPPGPIDRYTLRKV